MAIENYTINNGKWKKISNAGETGSAWLKSTDDGTATILISHTDAVLTLDGNNEITTGDALPDLDVDKSYLLPSAGISDTLKSDNSNDIYYATILDIGESADINADFSTG